MKILNINKFFYIKGGAETYYFGLEQMLKKNGHEVMHFSMADSHNQPSPYAPFFVQNINYFEQKSFFQKLKNAGKIIYSFEAKAKLEQLLKTERPDIAHLQNFHHQLSASILPVLKKYKIPIVYTAHDLKLVCGNYKMLANNKICEKCKGNHHIHCLKMKCVKGSRAASCVNTIEMYLNHIFKWNQSIDRIIAPSRFYRDKLAEFGIAKEKIKYLPNFIDASQFDPVYEGQPYFIYCGRLAEEKGLMTLIRSMECIEDAQLYLIGTGPMEDALKKAAAANGTLDKKIKFLGYRTGTDLRALMSNALFHVLPSEWYENGPYSVLEMMSLGKPAIAANIGGLPDWVQDGVTGLLFEPCHVSQLSEKINKLIRCTQERIEMGYSCRRQVEIFHSPDVYYQQLIQIYDELKER